MKSEMNSLTKGIESVVKNAIEEYIQLIVSKHENIDINDLEQLWNDVSKTIKISVETRETTTHTSKDLKPASKKKPVESNNTDGCPYVFIKGARQDEQCGSKPKEGNVYCSRHKKYEGTEQKDRKSTPNPKKNTVKPTKSKSRSPAKSVARVLRKHKGVDKLWHPDTGLAFRSAKERIVIGKIVDDKFVDLTEEDYDECRKWGFAFEPKEDPEDEPSSDNEDDTGKKKSYVYLVSQSPSGHKFWECTVSGVNYTTCYGKVGSSGTTKEKEFDTNDAALKEMTKMVAKKIAKGYEKSECVSDTPNETKKPKNPEKQFESPSDIEATLDELQGESEEEGDNTNALGKEFIPNALGLSKKAVSNIEDEDEDDDEILVEELDLDEE